MDDLNLKKKFKIVMKNEYINDLSQIVNRDHVKNIMLKNMRMLCICMVLPILSSCIAMSNLKSDDAVINSNEGIIILAVEPKIRVMFKRGKIENESFIHSYNVSASANVFPDDKGYIVLKLPALKDNQKYAITQLLPNGLLGKAMRPCNGASTFAFNVIPGEIAYLGDIKYELTESEMHAHYSMDAERAIRYLKERYPDFSEKLVTKEADFINVKNLGCKIPGLIIPIYIPS